MAAKVTVDFPPVAAELQPSRSSASGAPVVFARLLVGVSVDCPGADSDRLFQAGADVLLQGPTEQLFRRHCPSVGGDPGAWVDLATRYDLVLVEGFKRLPFRKIWLLGEGEQSPPAGIENIAAVLDRGCDRPAQAWDLITSFLQRPRR